MNTSLVLLVITLLGTDLTAARRNHGRRFDYSRYTANAGSASENDRGDEYRELNSQLPTKDQVIKHADGQESILGYNAHTVEPTITSVVEETTNFGRLQKDFTINLHEDQSKADDFGIHLTPLSVRGYGFKFSSVIPQDIRYTYEKNKDQPDSFSLTEQAEGEQDIPSQGLELPREDAEIHFEQPPILEAVHQALNIGPSDSPIGEVPEPTQAQEDESYHNDGLNIGISLTSIAQGSADRAQSAVIGQHVAAQQAAFVAKNALAQSAIHSAATAIAALAGKEVLVGALEKEAEEIHESLGHEIEQLQATKKTTSAARHAAQQAAYHVSVLAAALNNAQQAAEHAEANEKSAAAELASQTRMVGDAKARLNDVVDQLKAAQIDFEATKEAAAQATQSADEAQQNAHLVGEHASFSSHANPSIAHPSSRTPTYDLHEAQSAIYR